MEKMLHRTQRISTDRLLRQSKHWGTLEWREGSAHLNISTSFYDNNNQPTSSWRSGSDVMYIT